MTTIAGMTILFTFSLVCMILLTILKLAELRIRSRKRTTRIVISGHQMLAGDVMLIDDTLYRVTRTDDTTLTLVPVNAASSETDPVGNDRPGTAR